MTMGQLEKWEEERIELEAKMHKRLDELIAKEIVLEAVKRWMGETWDNMNVAHSNDDKRKAHPRWELKRILQSSDTMTMDKARDIRENIIERDRELLEKLNTGSKKVRPSETKVIE